MILLFHSSSEYSLAECCEMALHGHWCFDPCSLSDFFSGFFATTTHLKYVEIPHASNLMFYLLSESLSISTPDCGCKLLTNEDYINLLWTTFAEFPGRLKFHNN